MAGNANSGGRPLPRAVKAARGTLRPDRDGTPDETVEFPEGPAVPGAVATPAPDWLEADAAHEWELVVPMLEKARVLSAADYTQLANYCAANGLAVKASKQLKREGLLKKRANGSMMANPLIAIAREARAQALRAAIEFGLTPAARTRIRKTDDEPNVPDAPKGGAPTAADEFLFGGKPAVPLQLVSTATKANGEKP